MSLFLTLQTAWRGLLSHRLRTLLTMSGIVVGVAALIATLAIGRGSRDAVESRLEAMGRDAIYVWASWRPIEGKSGRRKEYRIHMDDWKAIAELPDVKQVTPVIWDQEQVVYKRSDCNTRIMGIAPAFLSIFHWGVKRGRTFTPEETTNGATVVLLGDAVATKLFGAEDPVGKSIRIGRTSLTVVGSLAPAAEDGMVTDDCVLLPVGTASVRLIHNHDVGQLVAEPRRPEQLDAVGQQIVQVLGERNHSTSIEESHKAFDVRTAQQMVKTSRETSQTFSLLIFLTASLSLLVGGIGIMNTMMMAVYERTREIGIRAALGSRPSDILLLFLAEALMLTSIGGGLGVALGTELSIQLAGYVQWPPVISLGSILLSMACATSVGLFAGLLPAWRASRMEPLACLRAD
jgi:putative ABC transport system permease protein